MEIVKSLDAGQDLEKIIREIIKKDLEINKLNRDMIYDRTSLRAEIDSPLM